MNNFLKVFSSEDNLKTSIELFFTEEGVKTLMQCDAEQGMMAFLKSNNDFGLSDAEFKKGPSDFCALSERATKLVEFTNRKCIASKIEGQIPRTDKT